MLAPYEELLWYGEPCPVDVQNPALSVSACRRGAEIVVLVANYSGGRREQAVISPLRGDRVAMKDLRTKVALSVPAKFQLGPSEFALVYIKGE